MLKKIFIIMTLLMIVSTSFSQVKFQAADKKIISLNNQYLIAPRWSPDGNYIAAAGANYGSIWLFNVKTEKWKRLVEENAAGWDFDWSPDSKNIAYRANILKNFLKQTAIKFVNISTGKIVPVTEYERDFSPPRWVNADVIAFLHNDKLQTVSASRNSTAKLRANIPQKNICLFSSDGIYARAQNHSIRLLEPLKGQTMNASYSPDGATILFQKPGSKIFSYHEASQTVKFITEGEMPAWSPDGKYIVFANPMDDGHRFISSDIIICDAAGKNKQAITQTDDDLEMRPHWSPDGNKIVCDSKGKIILIYLSNEVK